MMRLDQLAVIFRHFMTLAAFPILFSPLGWPIVVCVIGNLTLHKHERVPHNIYGPVLFPVIMIPSVNISIGEGIAARQAGHQQP